MAERNEGGGTLFNPWFKDGECSVDGVRVLTEHARGRDKVFETLVDAAADHVVGLKAIGNRSRPLAVNGS